MNCIIIDDEHLSLTLLADYIEKLSGSKYQCYVPQDFEQPTHRGVDIRNVDLKAVMSCDFGLFNFDGPDIDSGTVVEFMMAKFLDIPAVILRSDFRSSGDSERGNWNLMDQRGHFSRMLRFESDQVTEINQGVNVSHR